MSSRELFRWKRNGKEVHIFNPSAIALSVFAIILISTETMHFTWGEAIARAHGNGPYSYEIIFGAGLFVSAIFTVGFTISSAAATTLIIGEVYYAHTGIFRYVDTGIPIAVFLGMNLLVTDPVSSPWRRDAKVLYGALYGLSVFLLYGFLRDLERLPTSEDIGLSAAFCDKLLAVPLLNLSSRHLDRCMEYLFGDGERGMSRWVLKQEKRLTLSGRITWPGRLIFVGAWCVVFLGWIRPEVREHRGKDINFWVKVCEETQDSERHPYACENLKRMYLRACESSSLPACHNLALSLEDIRPSQAQKLYRYACHHGQLESCNHLGGMLYKRGDQSQDPILVKQALNLLKIACAGDVIEACTRQASILRSKWTDRSTWNDQDWSALWILLEKGCQGGEPYACLELSQYFLMPPPIVHERCQQDDQLACLTIKKALKIMNQSSIENTPHGIQIHPLHTQARQQLSTACGGGLQIACVNLGWMMWRGDGGPRDSRRALQLLEKSCQAGLAPACERAQWMRLQNASTHMRTAAPSQVPESTSNSTPPQPKSRQPPSSLSSNPTATPPLQSTTQSRPHPPPRLPSIQE